MASYDLYTPIKGPDIQVSLFGDAAKAGTAVGQAVPSTTSSIIQGVTQGLKQGMDFYQGFQQIGLNEQNARLNERKLDVKEQTQELEIKAENAKNEFIISKAEEGIALREKKQQFLDIFKTANPAQKDNLLLSGQYQDIFSADKELYNQVLSNVAATSQNQDIADLAGMQLKKNQTASYYEKKAYEDREAFNMAAAKVDNDPLTAQLSQKGLKGPREQYPDLIEWVPSGQYKVTEGGYIEKGPRGRVVNPDFDRKLSGDTWDVFEKGTDRLLVSGARNESNLNYHDFQNRESLQNGRYQRQAIDQIEEQAVRRKSDKVQAAPAKAAPTLGKIEEKDITAEAVKASQDPVKEFVKSTFKLDDTQVAKLSAPIANLRAKVEKYDSTAANRVEAAKEIQESVSELSRSIADSQYDSNPAIQEKYTTKDEEKWNRGVDDLLNVPYASAEDLTFEDLGDKPKAAPKKRVSNVYSPYSKDPVLEAIADLYKVRSPKDLYAKTVQEGIELQVSNLITGMQKAAQAATAAPIRKAESDKKAFQILKNMGQGGD